jgi:uncharacterized protein (TIGR02217 family)
MSNAIFTGVGMAGLTFPITRRMQTSTIQQTSASGMEVRSPNYQYPRWQWDLIFTYLNQNGSISDYQNFLGFLGARSGPYDSFLLYDENDCYVSNQIIGTGNGVTLAFQLQRSNGAQTQPIYDINGITTTLAPAPAVNIYVAGVLQSIHYGVSSTGLLTFDTGYAPTGLITADFGYFWRVRVEGDELEMSVMGVDQAQPAGRLGNVAGIWECRKVTLQSVRA